MEAKVIIDVDELSDICYDISMAVMNTDWEEENIRGAIQTELEKYIYKREVSQE